MSNSAPPAPPPPGPPTAPQRRWQIPRLDPNERWIGGVAAAIARELGVEPLVIRASFTILVVAGGWGLALYAAAWLALSMSPSSPLAPYEPKAKASSPFHRHIAITMIVLGLLLALRDVAFFVDRLVFPIAFALTGFLVAWTRHRSEDGIAVVIRILIGVTLAAGGMIAFLTLSTTNIADALFVLVIAIAVVAGVALVATPTIARIGNELDDERQNRVRADERARVAAHLHDSVLQTLALIQRHASDPTRTAQLARQQERELRNWLYATADDGPPGTVNLERALDEMAADVDALHGIPIKVITVGDGDDLQEAQLQPIVAASKEAAVNAARHSGTKRVDIFAERLVDRIEIFVRDTGAGFDPATTAADRKGIAESIIGRMERAGGTATITSERGEGTEVELVLPLSATSASSGDPVDSHPTNADRSPIEKDHP